MNVTEADRERAAQVVAELHGVSPDELNDHQDREWRNLIADALAEERERARAPFLALAESLEDGMRTMGYADGHHEGAAVIRRAAEESA